MSFATLSTSFKETIVKPLILGSPVQLKNGHIKR